ncbi:hypothetical protein [Amycolatopsis methanolica]|uniref:Putative merR-family transcriptional regulator n=1 Tax=Amycolatopsis methanolica 239 TaxID=1068978 RepID=A0A076MQU5_AMYME|nr:hypothetical protein [Amycolatopsis methanolica]AIJ21321.1 putative merR-family transcriptional regulator [Amycolatopsis methanolica 239]
MADAYRSLGRGYSAVRQPDPRIARQVHAALGAAATVLNVGAGAGSYEPDGRNVLAVEPSATMLRQRPPGSAPAGCAVAGHLPCVDDRLDAALAVLTVRHWRGPAAGAACPGGRWCSRGTSR